MLQLILAFILSVSCLLPAKADASAATPLDVVIKETLENIRENGFNGGSGINEGLGGLWINWRYGSNPLSVNNGRAQVYGGKPSTDNASHDRLTDLRYLHNLLSYHSLYPSDHAYDSEIERYTKIVKADFPDGTDQRGWVFFDWMDMYDLTKDPFFRTAGFNLAAKLDRSFYHDDIGALYKISQGDSTGKYKPSEALGQAGALCAAGKTFNKPEWTEHGLRSAHFIIAHSYLPRYGAFLGVMTDVVGKDGTANPNESIYVAPSSHGYTIDGGNFRLGEMGDAILGLLHVAAATGDRKASETAASLLDDLTETNNRQGLWDQKYGGYFYGLYFDGDNYANPGTLVVKNKSKEAGRQLVMLSAYHLANKIFAHRYATMEKLLVDVAINKAYYKPGHGYLYETNVDWSPRDRHGKIDDYVTTEAMGCALEALLEIKRDSKDQ